MIVVIVVLATPEAVDYELFCLSSLAVSTCGATCGQVSSHHCCMHNLLLKVLTVSTAVCSMVIDVVDACIEVVRSRKFICQFLLSGSFVEG